MGRSRDDIRVVSAVLQRDSYRKQEKERSVFGKLSRSFDVFSLMY